MSDRGFKVGFKPYRLIDNPKEKELHNKFIERFDNGYGMDTIVYPSHHGDYSASLPSDILTYKEQRIMISTIQWLGSHVGEAFLRECGFELVPKQLDSKGTWGFERSSGYAGYRCSTCRMWVYSYLPQHCSCDDTKV